MGLRPSTRLSERLAPTNPEGQDSSSVARPRWREGPGREAVLGTRDMAMLSCERASGGTHPAESSRLSSGSSQAFLTQS